MVDIKTFLDRMPSRISSLQEKALTAADDLLIGWQCNALSETGLILGSGTASDREEAKRVAIAEFIERVLFQKIAKNENSRAKFWIDEDSSTSGFAAGFQRETTRFRAFSEALERWAWSKWIDESNFIPEVSRPELSDLATGLLSFFDAVQFWQIPLPVESGWGGEEILFSVVLGFKNSGVFPGSRVTSRQDDTWTHGAVEAWRNLNNYQILKAKGDLGPKAPDPNQWIVDRMLHFGDHSEEALRQIPKQPRGTWPIAKMRGVVEFATGHPSVFLWRAMCLDYRPWQQGAVGRFVY